MITLSMRRRQQQKQAAAKQAKQAAQNREHIKNTRLPKPESPKKASLYREQQTRQVLSSDQIVIAPSQKDVAKLEQKPDTIHQVSRASTPTHSSDMERPDLISPHLDSSGHRLSVSGTEISLRRSSSTSQHESPLLELPQSPPPKKVSDEEHLDMISNTESCNHSSATPNGPPSAMSRGRSAQTPILTTQPATPPPVENEQVEKTEEKKPKKKPKKKEIKTTKNESPKKGTKKRDQSNSKAATSAAAATKAVKSGEQLKSK